MGNKNYGILFGRSPKLFSYLHKISFILRWGNVLQGMRELFYIWAYSILDIFSDCLKSPLSNRLKQNQNKLFNISKSVLCQPDIRSQWSIANKIPMQCRFCFFVSYGVIWAWIIYMICHFLLLPMGTPRSLRSVLWTDVKLIAISAKILL